MTLQKFLLPPLLFLSINTFAAPAYLLFGGDNHDKFLGCLNCSKHDNSSIWNKYGTYGSKYNSESPWNKYSTSGPVIVDNEGNFYGKFTTNKYDNQTRIKSLLWILENHEYIIENINDVIDEM